jgi:hypothetical protein
MARLKSTQICALIVSRFSDDDISLKHRFDPRDEAYPAKLSIVNNQAAHVDRSSTWMNRQRHEKHLPVSTECALALQRF